MNSAFYDAVRETVFGGSIAQSQVDGIEIIETAWTLGGDGDDFKLAYLLGTAFHETARTMQPVRETLAKTDAKAKEILTKAWKAGKLSWVKKDYWSSGWFGRGYVQLTHRENYVKAGEKLGIDLVSDPSKAMVPEVAALILVRGCMEGWFTGKKLGDYINRSQTDYGNARRVVNGMDRSADIAKIATSFFRAIEAARAAVASQPVEAKPVVSHETRSVEHKPKGNLLGWIIIAVLVAAAVGWFFFFHRG